MPSQIAVPDRLDEIVSRDSRLDGALKLALSFFHTWFSDNKVVFFPEYTDHGPDHVEAVIQTAEAIIRHEAFVSLTPQDAAVLILSILLHDSAMHLSEDAFSKLITGNYPGTTLTKYGDQPWSNIWAAFLEEASRFDGKKLNTLFGDRNPIKPPLSDPQDMTRRDRLLIGEFLRRHHARLAHEFACFGIPGATPMPFGVQAFPSEYLDLAGFVARSHNLHLRKAVDYLPPAERRQKLRAHVPFLMAVVRIADFLQIDYQRAPADILRMRQLRSPLSRGEWQRHQAIGEVHTLTDDPEALYVGTNPPDIKTFVSIDRLLTQLQHELDEVWAVLGEVYGRFPECQAFGLKLRRVSSNISALGDTAEKKLPYYPMPASFSAAGGDLLGLLVTPLYGQSPEYGIRELVQNALDACREFDDLRRSGITTSDDLRQQPEEVVVKIETDDYGSGVLTVQDRGVGMTPEIVRNYFLCAGASFRRSDVWRRQHAEEGGRSRVLRSGRFGIGVLAAFLLGDKIEVWTRHALAKPEDGVYFSCTLEDEIIELDRCTLPIGTRIQIRLDSKQTLDRLIGPENTTPDLGNGTGIVSIIRVLSALFATPMGLSGI